MKEKLKSLVKSSPTMLRVARKLRDGTLFQKSLEKSIKGKSNTLKIHPSVALVNCKIDVKGNANEIVIEPNCQFKNVLIFIRGNSNSILISKQVSFNRSGELWVEDDHCQLQIGNNTTFENTHIAVTESNSKVIIGDDCMFANGIDIRTGDSHAIIDLETKERINHAKDVVIGSHVWVGAHASILKGVRLAANCIVATRAIVSKPFLDEGVIIAGIPAKIIKRHVTWQRER